MKNLILKHIFSLSLLVITTTFYLFYLNNSSSNSDFVTIKVQPGDSLGQLSSDYSKGHTLTKKDFISWVEKENKLTSEKIKIGQKLVIPVNKTDSIHKSLLAMK